MENKLTLGKIRTNFGLLSLKRIFGSLPKELFYVNYCENRAICPKDGKSLLLHSNYLTLC